MDITEASIIHHVGIVFLVIWFLSSINFCHPIAYFLSFIYLYLVHDIYSMRFRRKVQFEEKRQANQKRVLSDSESVRWLNHIVERIWPVCMEEIVSQKILLPIVPWFLQKYKPWTVKEAEVQNMYLGRSPPMFTEIRVCSQSTDDDHLVMELGMNFRTADDMSALLAVRLTKRLGFGMRAKMHLTGMHVEGKVLVGVKFLPVWPFLGRLRVCFVEPPYFQMTVKPVFAHGLDVTELPGIAGWLDKLLTHVFEETLVEPNMLVVDVEKFVSLKPETWFSVDAKEPVAYVFVEIVEALDMKPSDMNGVADPYVKGQLGAYRFRTKTQKKTMSPKWGEEFKIPITTWDSPNVLDVNVCDKDHFIDDTLGKCNVKINDLRGGKKHDIWLPLQNIKMGRLHLAIKVTEVNGKVPEQPCNENESREEFKKYTFATDSGEEGASSGELPEKSPQVVDNFEPIDVKGQSETGIWVHHPGTKVPQVWAHRKGKNRSPKDSESVCSSADESLDGYKTNSRNAVKRGLWKIGSVFQRSPKAEIDKISFEKRDKDNCGLPLPSPRVNLRAVSFKGISVNLVMEDNLLLSPDQSPEDSGPESPNNSKVKNMAKSIMKHAGNSARSVRHVLTRKGSRRGRDRDLSVESDSSCEGSVPEHQGEVSPSFHNSIPKHDRRSSSLNSLNSEDVPGLMDSNEVAMDSLDQTGKVGVDTSLERLPMNNDANEINKVEVNGSGTTSQKLPYNSQGADDKCVDDLESSRPKISE